MSFYHKNLNQIGIIILTTFCILLKNSNQVDIEVQIGGPNRIQIPSLFNPFVSPEAIVDLMKRDPMGSQGGEGKVTTKTYTVGSGKNVIHVTEVRGFKNLNPGKIRTSPLQMMSNIDTFFDSIFQKLVDDMADNMFPVRIRREPEIENQQAEEEKIEEIDVSLDEEDEDGSKKDVKKEEIQKKEEIKVEEKEINKNNNDLIIEENNNINEKWAKPKNEEIISKKDEIKKEDKNKDKPHNDHHKGAIVNTSIKSGQNDQILTSKQKKKQIKSEKKRAIFSKVCKYIFYCIILFTFYVLLKGLFKLMEIVDESNPEEESKAQQEQTKTKIELQEIEKKENLGKQK